MSTLTRHGVYVYFVLMFLVVVVVAMSIYLIIRPFRKSLEEYDAARKMCSGFMKAIEVL